MLPSAAGASSADRSKTDILSVFYFSAFLGKQVLKQPSWLAQKYRKSADEAPAAEAVFTFLENAYEAISSFRNSSELPQGFGDD